MKVIYLVFMLLISLFEAKKVTKTPEYHRRARISFSNFGGVYDTKYNAKALREKLLQSDIRVFENDAIVAAEVEDNIRHVESTWQNGDLAQFEWAYGTYDCCYHRIRHKDAKVSHPVPEYTTLAAVTFNQFGKLVPHHDDNIRCLSLFQKLLSSV